MSALLMIPGPIEVSSLVRSAYAGPPPSHVSPEVIEAFGQSLENMRRVWLAPANAVPFVIAGSGTIAMDMAVSNLIDPGDRALVINTGYFSDRIAEMVRRRGGEVVEVQADIGNAPSLEAVAEALSKQRFAVMLATHVDTSTGVRVDAKGLAALATEHGALSVFDGVCATAGERFEMDAWKADVYLTASQKAVGLPAGLALMVASERAIARRAQLKVLPPMSLDWAKWQPIMEAYERRQPAYFSTPATNMIIALDVGLREILAAKHGNDSGIVARFAQHQVCADRLRKAWQELGLELLCKNELAANTLSAIRFPRGVDASLVKAVAARGVIIAGGLHPSCKGEYFRVGHMGDVITREGALSKTIDAIAAALGELRR
jgi:alanine-glyoxylate transaminase/serine-glyoxylate transaminase/serine-pyruvate transaminase